MRFIIKSAFWLGLVAFLIPFGGEPKETSANVTAFSLFLGAQQAIADLTGFCDRAPQACDTGRELAVFAGERIGDGIEMAYALVEGRIGERGQQQEPEAVAVAVPLADGQDPVTTGAVDTVFASRHLPSAYMPPKRDPQASIGLSGEAPGTARDPASTAPLAAVPTPTPAPRA